MKVRFLMVAEIEVRPKAGECELELAQEKLDTFREAALPAGHGILLTRVRTKDELLEGMDFATGTAVKLTSTASVAQFRMPDTSEPFDEFVG